MKSDSSRVSSPRKGDVKLRRKGRSPNVPAKKNGRSNDPGSILASPKSSFESPFESPFQSVLGKQSSMFWVRHSNFFVSQDIER